MAELLQESHTDHEGQADHFSCFSCREHVDQLSCLPCLHSLSVCERKECRQKLTERGACCELCKERFDLPAKGFPRYLFAERKAAAEKMKEEGLFCHAKHDTPQVAVVYCSDCSGPLCEECHNGHKTVAVLSEHRIISLEDSMKAGLANQRLSLLCPTHKKKLKRFCQDCEVLICKVCLEIGPHQSHSNLSVGKKVGEQNEQPLDKCIKSAEKRIKEVLSAVRDVEGRLLTLHDKGNRCKEDISDLKEHLIEAVNHRCAVLVAEVEETEKKKRRDLEQHKKALVVQKNKLELFKTSATEIVQEGTKIEQLSLCQAVIQRASSLTFTPLFAPPFSSNVFFVSNKKEAEKILSVMGHVSLGPDPEASSMEGLSIAGNTVQCRPWGLPLSIRVVSKYCGGLECVFGGERVESVLTPTSCGVPVQGEVEDRGDGTYQVAFRCLPSEECRLSVTVNGSDIRGSPMRVKWNDPSINRHEIKYREGRRLYALQCTKEGILLATDNIKGEVCCIAQSGEILTSFQVRNPGKSISGLALLSDGNIAVSVHSRDRVAVYRLNSERIAILVMEFGSHKLKGPRGLAVNHSGQLFVVDAGHHRVCVFTERGEFQYSFGSEGADPGQFIDPQQICISQDGLVYLSESKSCHVFQQDGRFVQQFGQDVLNGPSGLALTKDGHIVVASWRGNTLFIFTQSGECVHEVKEIGLNKPYGVAIADHDDVSIFVADSGNGRIVKL